jgi:hypothetical protein
MLLDEASQELAAAAAADHSGDPRVDPLRGLSIVILEV